MFSFAYKYAWFRITIVYMRRVYVDHAGFESLYLLQTYIDCSCSYTCNLEFSLSYVFF